MHLNNIGWYSSNGMGLVPISFGEIKAYMELTATPLTPDEVMIIRRMSQAYVNNVQNKDPNAKPPYGGAGIQKNNSFVNALKSIAKVKTPTS